MVFATRLKSMLMIAAAVAAATGLARAVATARDGQEPGASSPAEVAVTKKTATPAPSSPRPVLARGVIVDEEGRPVPGADVRVDAFTDYESRAVSGADGSFAIPVRRGRLDFRPVLARSADGARAGTFRYGYDLTPAAAEALVRIVLKPTREVVVRVADAGQAPIPGTTVEVVGDIAILDDANTGGDGTARLAVPSDATVKWIVALKPGRGFDYAEYGEIDGVGRLQVGTPVAKVPASVALTIDGARTVRIKAVDAAGKPLAGVDFAPWLLRKEGRRSDVNFVSQITVATTGPDGIATFDWLPPGNRPLIFWPRSDGYAHRRVDVSEDQSGPVTATLIRTETIRGRVVRPDDSPAPGVRVDAYGSGQGHDYGQDHTRTAADGSYELKVSPGEAYAVYVSDPDWAAPSRLDVVVREGESVAGVDFRLSRGTLIRGRVTIAPGDRPGSNEFIHLTESAGAAPEEVKEKGDRFSREVQRQFGERTDADGRYAIRVGPGTYTLVGPPRTGEEKIGVRSREKITVKDQAEVVRDFRMSRPEKGPIAGRVVAGPEGRGVAGAKVELWPATIHGYPISVTADAEGRFRTERALDKTVIHARSPDGTLGAIVEIGAETPEVVIPVAPTASATGLLLDPEGKPAASEKLAWGRRIILDEERQISSTGFAPKVKTDAEGRFTLPELVVGQEYGISLLRDNVFHAAGAVRPEKPGPIDLGTLRAGAYRRSRNPDEDSSFRKDAPGAGAVAPAIEATTLDGKPLTLADFRGKFVLLDFWATWCGPCLGEIPRLQAVHEAFGSDGSFAILSLSVDETIEEPRMFQETRKLPWAQAFLGDGFHGPTTDKFGIRAIPAFVLVGPDGTIVARGMRGDDIKKEVAKALAKKP